MYYKVKVVSFYFENTIGEIYLVIRLGWIVNNILSML